MVQPQYEFDQDHVNRDMERFLWADACKRRFWYFLQYGFGAKMYCEAHPAEDWIYEPVHEHLCDWTQARIELWMKTRAEQRKTMNLLYLLPRNFSKTAVISQALPMWLQLLDTEMSIAISSHSLDKAEKFLAVPQSIWSGKSGNAWFKPMYGMWEPSRADKARKWNNGECTHMARRDVERKDPSMECVSVATGGTGNHPDVCIFDDPVVEEKLVREGETWLRKCDIHIRSMIPVMQTNGLRIIVMTRYRDADPAAKAMRDQGVMEFAETGMKPDTDDFTWDPEGGKWRVFFMAGRDDDGEPVLPKVWPEEALLEYESDDPKGYASQIMQRPAEGRHQLVQREKIKRIARIDVPTNVRYSVHLDTAFKDPERMEKGDYNVIQVWAHSNNGTGDVFYWDGWRGNDWSPDDFYRKLFAILKKMRTHGMWPFIMTDEAEMGGKSGQTALVLQHYADDLGIPVPRFETITRSGSSKEARIRYAGTYWNNGKVWIVNEASGRKYLENEMVRFGFAEHDDMADAGADVVNQAVYTPARSLRSVKARRNRRTQRPMDDILKVPVQQRTGTEIDRTGAYYRRWLAKKAIGNPGGTTNQRGRHWRKVTQ